MWREHFCCVEGFCWWQWEWSCSYGRTETQARQWILRLLIQQEGREDSSSPKPLDLSTVGNFPFLSCLFLSHAFLNALHFSLIQRGTDACKSQEGFHDYLWENLNLSPFCLLFPHNLLASNCGQPTESIWHVLAVFCFSWKSFKDNTFQWTWEKILNVFCFFLLQKNGNCHTAKNGKHFAFRVWGSSTMKNLIFVEKSKTNWRSCPFQWIL